MENNSVIYCPDKAASIQCSYQCYKADTATSMAVRAVCANMR
jgi:hypothetical protein